MAGCAGSFIEIQLPGCVSIQKVWSMIRRFQIECRRMALGATKRRIHFAVANQAIFHMGKVLFADNPCLRSKTSMAGLARIVSDQVTTQFQNVEFVGRSEIFFAVDRARNDRGKIAEAEMAKVIEVLQHFAASRIAQTRGMLLRGMTSETLDFLLECLLMRNLLLLPKANQRQQDQD